MSNNEVEELRKPTVISEIVRVHIEVDTLDNRMCSDTCPFHKFIGFQDIVSRGCSAFHKELEETIVGRDGEIKPRPRDLACLEMFDPKKTYAGSHYKELAEHAAVVSKLARKAMAGMAPKKVSPSPVLTEQAPTAQAPESPSDTDEEEFELVNTNNDDTSKNEGRAEAAIDEDISDAALGLSTDTDNTANDDGDNDDHPYKPLDTTDPVVKDHAWKLYQDEAPVAFAVVAVYGVLFTANYKCVDRFLFKKVRVMPCTPAEHKILNLGKGFGYGKVIGTNETVEIHRWKKTKAYIKQLEK